jgi:hypothetical protein
MLILRQAFNVLLRLFSINIYLINFNTNYQSIYEILS